MSERLEEIRRRVKSDSRLFWPEEVTWLLGEVDRLEAMLSKAPISEEHELARKVFKDNDWEVCAKYGHEADASQCELWREEWSKYKVCLDCRFWRQLDGAAPLYNASGGPMDWTGFCHRYPPARNDTDPTSDDAAPAVTRHDDWCGEYVENEGACRRNPLNSAENGGFADNGDEDV
jgi:hypothetical protein